MHLKLSLLSLLFASCVSMELPSEPHQQHRRHRGHRRHHHDHLDRSETNPYKGSSILLSSQSDSLLYQHALKNEEKDSEDAHMMSRSYPEIKLSSQYVLENGSRLLHTAIFMSRRPYDVLKVLDEYSLPDYRWLLDCRTNVTHPPLYFSLINGKLDVATELLKRMKNDLSYVRFSDLLFVGDEPMILRLISNENMMPRFYGAENVVNRRLAALKFILEAIRDNEEEGDGVDTKFKYFGKMATAYQLAGWHGQRDVQKFLEEVVGCSPTETSPRNVSQDSPYDSKRSTPKSQDREHDHRSLLSLHSLGGIFHFGGHHDSPRNHKTQESSSSSGEENVKFRRRSSPPTPRTRKPMKGDQDRI